MTLPPITKLPQPTNALASTETCPNLCPRTWAPRTNSTCWTTMASPPLSTTTNSEHAAHSVLYVHIRCTHAVVMGKKHVFRVQSAVTICCCSCWCAPSRSVIMVGKFTYVPMAVYPLIAAVSAGCAASCYIIGRKIGYDPAVRYDMHSYVQLWRRQGHRQRLCA